MKDADSRLVDRLVGHAVRHVLFPGLSGGGNSSPSPMRLRSEADNKRQAEADARESVVPFPGREDRYTHVLSYASWSDAQLRDEKLRLRRLMGRSSKQKQANPEEEDDEKDSVVMEAIALLDLFERERHARDNAASPPSPPTPTPPRLLHAQLDLFAKYFEATHQREIRHELDVVPVHNMYKRFLTQQQQQQS